MRNFAQKIYSLRTPNYYFTFAVSEKSKYLTSALSKGKVFGLVK